MINYMHANVIVGLTQKGTVAHRLEEIDGRIALFEQKYGMPFERFLMQGEEGVIQNQFSYEVERDYLEWGGLISRRRVMKSA